MADVNWQATCSSVCLNCPHDVYFYGRGYMQHEAVGCYRQCACTYVHVVQIDKSMRFTIRLVYSGIEPKSN